MHTILYTNSSASKERVQMLTQMGAMVAESVAKERRTSVANVIWHQLLQNNVAVFFVDRQYIDGTLKSQIYKALASKASVVIRDADGLQVVLDNTEDKIPNELYDVVEKLMQGINAKYGRIAEQKRVKATEDGALRAIRRLLSERMVAITNTMCCLVEYDDVLPMYAKALHVNVPAEVLVTLCNRLADVYDIPRPTPDPENYHPELFDSCGYWTTKGGSTEPKRRHNAQYMTDTWMLPKDSRRYNEMYERDGCNEYTDWDACYQLLYYLSVGLLP